MHAHIKPAHKVFLVGLISVVTMTGCAATTQASAPAESSPTRDASELLRAMVCINTSSESSKSLMWDSNSLDTKGNWIASKNITFNKDSLPNCAISSNGFGPDNLSWGVDGVTYWIGIKNSAEIKFTGAFGGKNLTGSNTMYFGGTGQFDKASVQVEKTPTEVNGMQVMLISVNYF